MFARWGRVRRVHGRHHAADPLYGLYQEKFGFSELTVTVVYAVYAFGVIGVLLLAGNASDAVGGVRCCCGAWDSRRPAPSASCAPPGWAGCTRGACCRDCPQVCSPGPPRRT